MSGHSKWKNIMHKKEKTDAQRAKVFTKIGKEITIAVKEGGPDPVSNSKLRDLIAKAKANNVPNDNIERIIKKASGSDAVAYEELVYEGYGPSGVAVIVEAATDNKNRTAGDVRHYFDKFGGKLGLTGCVGFMFSQKGVIVVAEKDEYGDKVVDADKLMEDALECGAADFAEEDGYYEIYTEPDDLSAVCEALSEKNYKFESAEVEKVPATYVSLDNEDDKKMMNLLIENLEENEDIVNVWHNWDEN
ncbi:MAG: YebC/PmpR family DNA-binding transcriptional regulator [Eubacteriales bacterium]